MTNFSNAVKAFIVKDNCLLLIKRRADDTHMPATWDQPGGRLNPGESPFLGLQREVKEEIGLDCVILTPLDIHYFTRDDGQSIQLTVFICSLAEGEARLSTEHTEYIWKPLSDSIDGFPENFRCCVEKYNKYWARHS